MINAVSPKVSVCIPVYNGGAYIAESIQSVLAQTYKDFRLIVCDNCSTDNTEEIVRSFHDPRITYLKNSENIGLVGNFNRVINLSDGEYVCLWAHDDVMLPDNIEQKVRVLDENPRVGLVHSDVLMIDHEGNPLNFQFFADAKRDYIEDGKKVFQRYIMHMSIGALFFIGAVLARRNCYTKLGCYNPALPNACDSEMWMRISLFYDIACIGRPLVKYRYHQTMTSTSINDSNGLTLQGLKEHYLASTIILNKFKDRIPGWKRLKVQVEQAFASQLMNRGLSCYYSSGFASGRPFFMEALKIYPQVVTKRVFWGSMKRLILKPNSRDFKKYL